MNPRKSSRRLPVAKVRDLEVMAATAREAVNRFHVDRAIALIELAADRVSAVRMLDIYLRLHGLSGAEAEVLSYSVLAALGHRARRNPGAGLLADPQEPAGGERASLLRMLKARLKGRVHHDLRRQVEISMGAAQAGMIEIHVQYAIRFARELAETCSVAQSTEMYAQMAGVPARLEEMLYVSVLDRLAEQELPSARNEKPRAGITVLPQRPRRAV